jgi:DNA polymerase-3 subunit alpha
MNKKDFDSNFSNINLPLHGVRLPEFTIDNVYKHKLEISEDSSNYDFLKALALKGFKELNLKKDSQEYKKYIDRAKYELDTLKELEFVDYILLVWNVINYCKESNIPVGLGRGSAAGSLILYLIGVTNIDPVKYDLYFERFISKIRAKKQVIDGVTYLDGSLMCDVDLDICYYNRHKVLQYLEEKFKGKTSKILTLNTLSGKLLIKECGKIIGEKTDQEMTEVS